MIFNSSEFFHFFSIFLLLYYLSLRQKIWARNALILVSSLIFYGWIKWSYLLLIVYSIMIDYVLGQLIYSSTGFRRKMFLAISIISNIGLLFYFKYFGWIYQEVTGLSLTIFLPIGISFYTFQTISYSYDIYKGKLEPERNLLTFASFVTFFPQLVAGPIERASNLLPQFRRKSYISWDRDKIDIIILGFYQKIILGDGFAGIVERSWNNMDNGLETIIGIIAFSIQIYGDFAGYSNIAIGIAGLLGFSLMENFNSPYKSSSVTEFWSRWHISLSTWFRDYLYIPLGGNRRRVYLNLLIVFLISGLWHGANWTFILWGAMHGLAVILERIYGRLDTFSIFLGRSFTLFFVSIAWVFFRAPNIYLGIEYINSVFNSWTIPVFTGEEKILICLSFLYFIRFIGKMIWKELDDYLSGFFLGIVIFIIYIMSSGDNSFIYFQF